MTIGAWATVGPNESYLLKETMRPMLESSEVEKILIVHTGHEPSPHFGYLANHINKVTEIHRDFGEGLDISIEKGGYDQLSARTFALDKISDESVDWLVQFDADEFLTKESFKIIENANDSIDLICFDYWTLTSRETYWKRKPKEFGGKLIMDPHPLIWRNRLQVRPELCKETKKTGINITRHASVRLDYLPPFRIQCVNGMYHFHLHGLLKKKNFTRHTPCAPFDKSLPTDLTNVLNNILI